jgi:hypothetical protein
MVPTTQVTRSSTPACAEFQCDAGVGAADGGLEQLALLVPDVDEERLLVGVLIDGCDHVIDVTLTCVGHHIVGGRRLSPVADLAGLGDVAGSDRHPPE